MQPSNGMAAFRRMYFSVALLGIGTLLGAGCGGGSDDPTTAAVSGKVTRGGQPVSGGTVMFSPRASADKKAPGKPAASVVGTDGTFTLTTYAKNDGAVIGKHQVTYTPAPDRDRRKTTQRRLAAGRLAVCRPGPFQTGRRSQSRIEHDRHRSGSGFLAGS